MAAGFNVNIPWPCAGMGDAEYLAAFDRIVMPICTEFAPELVLVSAGFDSAAGDPLGACNITPAGYHRLTHRLQSLAGGRVVCALEGGYNLRSIAQSVEAVVRALLQEPASTDSVELEDATAFTCSAAAARTLDRCLEIHRAYWHSLR